MRGARTHARPRTRVGGRAWAEPAENGGGKRPSPVLPRSAARGSRYRPGPSKPQGPFLNARQGAAGGAGAGSSVRRLSCDPRSPRRGEPLPHRPHGQGGRGT